MPTQSHTAAEILETFNNTVIRGEIDEALKYLHPDVQVIEAESLPYGGIHRGPEGFVALLQKIGSIADVAFPVMEIFHVNDSTCVARIDMALTNRKSGETFTMTVVEVDTVENGLITRVEPFYRDTERLNAFYAECRA